MWRAWQEDKTANGEASDYQGIRQKGRMFLFRKGRMLRQARQEDKTGISCADPQRGGFRLSRHPPKRADVFISCGQDAQASLASLPT